MPVEMQILYKIMLLKKAIASKENDVLILTYSIDGKGVGYYNNTVSILKASFKINYEQAYISYMTTDRITSYKRGKNENYSRTDS